jgi:hypothetical protein
VIRLASIVRSSRHRRLASTLLVGAVTMAAAHTSRAQEPDPLIKLDPNSKFAVELILDSAKVEKLPTQPLLSRALEGVARKVDGKRIVDAVRKELGYLRTARSVLGGVPDDELTAAAGVVEVGAKPAQLAVFRTRHKDRNDLAAFTYWADLITRGVPPEDASSAIAKLWQDGADDATFYSLWKSVNSDILQGLNPGAALQNRIRESPGRTPTSKTPPEGPQETKSL